MRAAIGRLILTALAAGVGYVAGWIVGASRYGVLPQPKDYPFLAETVPLPHHVPEHPGGVSLRFAMVHDVIHERFPRHGPAHYRERERLTRAELERLGPEDPAAFPLLDDLGAGLERLGRSDEAAEVIRGKLKRQLARGLSGRDLYTSYANLGTFLIHASLPKARAGDPGARARFAEGLDFVRKSVGVYPEAHFGRERWQVAIAEFLLAAIDRPALLREFDCLGNRLDLGIEPLLNREVNWTENGYGRPTDARFSRGEASHEVPGFFRPVAPLDDPAHWAEFAPIRGHITRVGAEAGWDAVAVPSHRAPVPFDEPTLGILGMWRRGGGANPHFALALGETMLRVGQRYIAWAAFERAAGMAGRSWPDPATQQALVDHCRRRQSEIEATLAHREPGPGRRPAWQTVSPPPDPEDLAHLRDDFGRELALGEGYRRAYQAYEAAKIAAGTPITDEHFFDAFLDGRPPIASPTGPEEEFARIDPTKMFIYGSKFREAGGVFGAGLAAMGAALALRRRGRPAVGGLD